MTEPKAFEQYLVEAGGQAEDGVVGHSIYRFGGLAQEYEALTGGAAIVPRLDRGLVRITGADRLSWLNNLMTNQLINLDPGSGAYAFAVNVQGRILFDANVLVRPEFAWLDVDRRFLADALAHLEKYHIVEDVELEDVSDSFARIAMIGPGMIACMEALGAGHAKAMPSLAVGSIEVAGVDTVFFRHDACGPPGVELIVPEDRAVAVWQELRCDAGGVIPEPVGIDAVNVRRIESGIPWPGCELTAEVLPAETRQLERAVSYVKGCYLGQEVVERMRSRKVVAKWLTGLECAGKVLPSSGAEIVAPDGKVVGKVTSSCHSCAKDADIALGYVRNGYHSRGQELSTVIAGAKVALTVADLPFVPAGD